MTSSPAELAGSSADAGVARSTVGLLAVGRVAAVLSLVLCVLVQAVNHDFFPPDISISQYGIGPRGWVFTCWTVAVSVAVLALHRGGAPRARGAGYWLGTGSLGLIVMGVVRTDADGLQHSLHAKVHMTASIVALVALPIGMALAMAHARPWLRRAAWLVVVCGAAALILVLVSAAGVATPGLDAQHSWALWQAVAVSLDMLLIAMFGFASLADGSDRSTDPAPGASAI